MGSEGPGRLATIACILEVMARKAGNVHPGAAFEDAHAIDFLLSAAAIGPVFDRVAEYGVGRTVLEAIRATRQVVATNTNLGMVLLLAPLAAARDEDLNPEGLGRLLDGLSVEDAAEVYEAIRLARPGGLGSAAEQDVSKPPSLPLRQVMGLAADRDLVARQYAEGYPEVLGTGIRGLGRYLERGESVETAIVGAHLELLAACGDTLIARKRGQAFSAEAARRASAVLAAGWPWTERARVAFAELDDWLRAEGNTRNPGATADLTAAVVYVGLRTGVIELPLKGWAAGATRKGAGSPR